MTKVLSGYREFFWFRYLFIPSSFAIRASSFTSAFHFQQQHGHVHFVAHFVDSRPVKNVVDETVPVRCHSDQIDASFAGELDDFVGRFSERQNGITCEAFFREFACPCFQIRAVVFHLLAFGKLELLEIPCHPAIGHVNQKQRRASYARERFDMRQDRLISGTVLERNQNVFIHGRNDEIRMAKLEGMTKPKARKTKARSASSFELPVLFRHSSFGLRYFSLCRNGQMKETVKQFQQRRG